MNDMLQKVIADNTPQLERFFEHYLTDPDIQTQILDSISKIVPLANSRRLVEEGVKRLTDQSTGDSDTSYAAFNAVYASSSLEFIVRHARKVDARSLPPEDIPSAEVVTAALALHHAQLLAFT